MGDVVSVCKKKEKKTKTPTTPVLWGIQRYWSWFGALLILVPWVWYSPWGLGLKSLQTDKWFSGVQSESFNYDVLGTKPPKDASHVVACFPNCQPRLWKVSTSAQILASSCETHRSNQCRRPSFYYCGCLPLHCVWSLEELLWRKSFTSCLWKADCLVKSQCSLTNAWVKVLMYLILNVLKLLLWQWIYKLKWN